MPVAAPEQFFQEKRSFTAIKQELFGKYLEAWCTLQHDLHKATGKQPLLFLDLEATADLATIASSIELNPYIYRNLLKRTQLQQPIQAYYAGKSKPELCLLTETIEALPFYPELERAPLPLNTNDTKEQLAAELEAGHPSLVFLDPFNYSYALQLMGQTMATGIADLFMLLQPDTLLKAVSTKKPAAAIVELFGEQLPIIQAYCRKEKCRERRAAFVLEQLRIALQDRKYFLQGFTVNQPGSATAEFYLLFASANSQACRVFKDIMLPYSVLQEDGVPLFIANTFVQPQTELFEAKPVFTISNLASEVLAQEPVYKYKSVEQIYNLGQAGTPYTRQNYLEAIEQLRKAGNIALLNGSTMQPIKRPVPTAKVKFRS